METTLISSATNQREQDMFRTISLTALLAGIFDISAAIVQTFIQTGKGPERMFKTIASGVFGKQAFDGGTLMIIWGLVFHFMIAFLFTAFLFLVYPKVAAWIKNKFVIGILYGVFVWAVMNLVVVPLSITHKLPSDSKKMIIAGLILICMIGIPVALMAHRYYSQKKAV
jgi:hypothetical protein